MVLKHCILRSLSEHEKLFSGKRDVDERRAADRFYQVLGTKSSVCSTPNRYFATPARADAQAGTACEVNDVPRRMDLGVVSSRVVQHHDTAVQGQSSPAMSIVTRREYASDAVGSSVAPSKVVCRIHRGLADGSFVVHLRRLNSSVFFASRVGTFRCSNRRYWRTTAGPGRTSGASDCSRACDSSSAER